MWMPFYINVRLKKVPNFSKTKDLSHKQDWFHHSILPAGMSICTCSLTARDYEPEPVHLSTEKCVFRECAHYYCFVSEKTKQTKNLHLIVCAEIWHFFVTYVNIKRHSHVCACVHVRVCMHVWIPTTAISLDVHVNHTCHSHPFITEASKLKQHTKCKHLTEPHS